MGFHVLLRLQLIYKGKGIDSAKWCNYSNKLLIEIFKPMGLCTGFFPGLKIYLQLGCQTYSLQRWVIWPADFALILAIMRELPTAAEKHPQYHAQVCMAAGALVLLVLSTWVLSIQVKAELGEKAGHSGLFLWWWLSAWDARLLHVRPAIGLRPRVALILDQSHMVPHAV